MATTKRNRSRNPEPVEVTAAERTAAVRTIAAHALDAEDCRWLCALLGLDPRQARGGQATSDRVAAPDRDAAPGGLTHPRLGTRWVSGS